MPDVTINCYGVFERYGVRLRNPVMDVPKPRYRYVQVPGRDGLLNITNALIGRPEYEQRTCVLSGTLHGTHEQIEAAKLAIARDMNGEHVCYTLPSYPGYRFYGDATVSTSEISDVRSDVEISITGDPFMVHETVYDTVNAYPAATRSITVGKYPSQLKVVCLCDLTVTVNGTVKSVEAGTRYLDLQPGENVVKFLASEWYCYESNGTLVVNDDNLTIASEMATFSGGNDAVSNSSLSLDDSVQYVEISYYWRDV